jgi:hypothetical protein
VGGGLIGLVVRSRGYVRRFRRQASHRQDRVDLVDIDLPSTVAIAAQAVTAGEVRR